MEPSSGMVCNTGEKCPEGNKAVFVLGVVRTLLQSSEQMCAHPDKAPMTNEATI